MSVKILGLDCSTNCLGYALLEVDDKKITLKAIDYHKPSKKLETIKRLAYTRDFIQSLIDQYTPNEIILENIIFFMPGKSTAKTIIKLAIVNRTICLGIYDKIGKPPILMNVLSIRHALKLSKKLPTKEEIPELIAYHLGIDFPYKYDKKQNKIAENFDMGDAAACALAFIFKLPQFQKEKPRAKVKGSKKK